MAATVTLGTVGRIAPMGSLSVVKVTVAANSVSYTATSGGLAFDINAALASAGPFSAPPNGNDVVGIIPLGLTSPTGFLPVGLALGTVTSTTCPCTVKFAATGTAGSAGFAEAADGVSTQSFTALVIIARGGTN